jgi:(p)ppGpp synthase/HD superfamily hydrolase
MSPRQSIDLAEQLAHLLAEGQFRRDKMGALMVPAIVHSEQVVALLVAAGADWVEVSAGWLHDTPEDALDPDAMFEHLRKAGVSPSVLEVVSLLTHRKGVSNLDYINQMIHYPDRKAAQRAMRVKRADIQANLADAPTAYAVEKYGRALKWMEAVS